MDHRLRKDKQFSYIYKKGVRKNTHFLVLFITDSKYKCYKIGYSISKKIGKANVRNRLKRRMREIVRTNSFAKDYHNYVLMAKEGIQNLNFEELLTEIKEVFNK